jgi:hypothetical protein
MITPLCAYTLRHDGLVCASTCRHDCACVCVYAGSISAHAYTSCNLDQVDIKTASQASSTVQTTVLCTHLVAIRLPSVNCVHVSSGSISPLWNLGSISAHAYTSCNLDQVDIKTASQASSTVQTTVLCTHSVAMRLPRVNCVRVSSGSISPWFHKCICSCNCRDSCPETLDGMDSSFRVHNICLGGLGSQA